ncbi:hypothetical protein, partial [Acutalibacter muris]|uniref:hypothetical protein n=1 Tax=Acutalibacter muris TaxID=1796620 RepID=UPI003FA43207
VPDTWTVICEFGRTISVFIPLGQKNFVNWPVGAPTTVAPNSALNTDIQKIAAEAVIRPVRT